MMESLLNQTAVWQKYLGTSGKGKPLVGADVAIAVRWEGKMRMIVKADGTSIMTEARIYTLADVKPNDYLVYQGQSRPVHAVAPQTAMDGETAYYEVWV